MKTIKVLLLLLTCIYQETNAQKANMMITYGQSDFIFSPGLEVNYFFYDKLGLELGVNTYFLNYQPYQLVNQSGQTDYYRSLYNGNIGLCGILLNYKKLKIGWTAGWKMYYGPNFIPLYFYEKGGYYIYSDSSGGKFDYGIDMGVLLYTKKHVIGIKYDTARGQIRWMAGWSF